MQDDVSKELFEMIVSPVLYDSDSPYKLMVQKLNDIDIDYFEVPEALCDKVDNNLRIEIKKEILNDFFEYGKMLIRDNADRIERQVKSSIRKWFSEQTNRKMALVQLDDVFRKIHDFTRRTLTYVSMPMYSKAELNELYEAALKVTLFERVTRSNDKDVIRYYHALISHTVWSCRMMTRRRASQYLIKLVDVLSREFDMNSEWATHYDDVPSFANTASYRPQPVDTSDVVLSSELMQLAERMAENVHDVWAASRLVEGWTYGPVRDDGEKKHPCLVPYSQLPESEKAYDRNTSLETLKFIVKEGFSISK